MLPLTTPVPGQSQANAPRSDQRLSISRIFKPWVAACLIGIITLVVFLPAVRGGFVTWDDDTNIVNNPYFRGLGWTQLRWMWTNHLMEHYVPLAWLTFGVDYHFWKDAPFGYHLTNVLLHSINAALFFLLALAILRIGGRGRATSSGNGMLFGAAFASLFFSLHPLRVESVAWVTERRDVLSGLFYLLALLAYLRAFRDAEDSRPRRQYYWACFVLFVLALLSKEMAVSLPVALLALDFYPLRRIGRSPDGWFGSSARIAWFEKIPFFLVSGADAVMTLMVAIRHHLPDSTTELGWIPRITITVYGLAFYLLKTVAPLKLSPLYPITLHKIRVLATPFLLSAAASLAITWIALTERRRFPWLLPVWVVYAVTILPVSGILHNGNQIVADRYSYLSCLGWAVLLGAGGMVCAEAVRGSRSGRALLSGAALLAVAGLSWATERQIPVWRNSEQLWGRAVAVEPSALSLNNLGSVYYIEGDTLGALDLFQRAIAMWPTYPVAHNNLGLALFDLKRFDEAAREFRSAQKFQPDFADPCNGLGNVLKMQGKLDAAVVQYRRAIQLKPDYPGAKRNLESTLKLLERRSQ